jgi:hypothetical protein
MNSLKRRNNFIGFSALAGILAIICDLSSQFILGIYYPGYDQMKETVSKLGSSNSPISVQISTLWVAVGLLLMVFGVGIKKEYSKKGRYAQIASGLIILYGFCEGIGSGSFKADRVAGVLTTSGIIHESLGSIGVIAIILFPLLMQKVIPKTENPAFYRLSQIIFVSGLFFIVLFLFRYSSGNNFLATYKGLWQRLFILNAYIYLSVIAFQMLKGALKKQQK